MTPNSYDRQTKNSMVLVGRMNGFGRENEGVKRNISIVLGMKTARSKVDGNLLLK